MRKIKLLPDKPFFNYCDIAIVDVTDGMEKKRGKLTIEYAKADITRLQKQGMDYDATLEYFKNTIDATVKYYILGDWTCTGGYDEVMEIIESHVKPYYSRAQDQ